MFTAEETPERKRAFARALLKYPEFIDAGKAAAEVESRSQHALYMAQQWRHDPEVNDIVRELREAGGLPATLPTKDEFALSVWSAALECPQKDTKLKYLELFAKTMNFIEKPIATIPNVTVNNNTDNRRVMLMPQPLGLDEWEAAAIAQQDRLLIEAAPPDVATKV